MKLMLFLGSGISVPSGLPRAKEITDSLLNESWHLDEISFRPGPPRDHRDPTLDLQCFLKSLKAYADGYYALRGGQEANYEDIYYLVQQLRDDEQGRILNPAILDFLTGIKAKTEVMSERIPRNNPNHSSFLNMLIGTCTLIQCVVEQKLSTPREIKGLGLVEALASSPDIERLDICTLNHDVLVERFLTEHASAAQIDVTDGFGQAVGRSTVRRFDPRLLESDTKVRVFKLHGSIDWFMFADTEGPFCGIPTNGDPHRWQNEKGERLQNVFGGPVVLAGTYNKIINYGFGIIAEMHFWFHRLLKEHDTIAMCGYGWNDLGVNMRLTEWFNPRAKTRLCLMHESPEEVRQNPRSLMEKIYNDLVSSRRLIPIKKWMDRVTMQELLDSIPASN
ncbi:MAG TPA: hypothetical protein VL486_13370 [Verrucomicrobiae bacterium]|nr:hypothetical protein [Verrucomicrobiae bacterium]